MTEYVAPYLTVVEYTCRHCLKLPPDFIELGEMYNQFFDDYWVILRGEFGGPIKITSGYRCPPHNKAIGGESCSAHCTGFALDCRPVNLDINRIVEIVEDKIPDVRMKVYPTFVHLDVAFLCKPRLRDNWVKGYRFHGN
jgi:hypothetical protein